MWMTMSSAPGKVRCFLFSQLKWVQQPNSFNLLHFPLPFFIILSFMRPGFLVSPLPGIFPKEIIREADINLWTKTFLAELFIITENRKNLNFQQKQTSRQALNIFPYILMTFQKCLQLMLLKKIKDRIKTHDSNFVGYTCHCTHRKRRNFRKTLTAAILMLFVHTACLA